jgi:hypothetical protein
MIQLHSFLHSFWTAGLPLSKSMSPGKALFVRLVPASLPIG